MSFPMTIDEAELNALQELVNLGVGSAAGTLNEMLDTHIDLQVPYVQTYPFSEAKHLLVERLNSQIISSVQLHFSGTFTGMAQIVFPTESASALISELTGEEIGSCDLDAVKVGTLSEVGNIVLNGVMGTIGNILHEPLQYSLPAYVENTVDQLLTSPDFSTDTTIILVQTHFSIQALQVTGDIILIFKVGSFACFLRSIYQYLEQIS
ncbi:chemotaxis protein CheC [Geitlerinema sp. PCC 9228]|uniref:chemotaxis protein CheC n=1 Tax=Geitlerinema sp. PCC 9228 TaxID=111611 RepID=UPI001FCE0C3F|nr:chemotaxis protein CheC [Geitlerinema sp. PCC 9228]